ncbi:MAG: HAMP domain-containing histidine kinase [Winogradskyella sp.]|uniref:sensor histidine kinase n=1 Tax=Winogradskyella sp. TaxID=1883156 RepID=UPI001790512D|nr:HAMP domain-containing sensor histidine kinase [Winogradskyella sp.]MBT8243624.1 HAMP domain-containing histidine kinase [Winogradskyella sp.]NNK23858.1 HAMP domain-containing histidine kinase [Winogradskyella sp.]
MNDKRYRYILYAITLVIITTIGIQAYWNYKNYLTNKQQLINDVQLSLDKAVDDYYANLAKETRMGISFENTSTKAILNDDSPFTKILNSIDEKDGKLKQVDSVDTSKIDGLKIFRGFEADSMKIEHDKKVKAIHLNSLKKSEDTFTLKGFKNKKSKDSISDIEMLSTMIFVSIKNDSLDVRRVNKLLIEDFKRKKIELDHNLAYFEKIPDSATQARFKKIKKNIPKNDYEDYDLQIESKSTFLPKGSLLKLSFDNETFNVLKRSSSGILISTFLILAVISCLFYLLKIIKHQKQLAEVKNDLISNITHEFKTPIATIGAALEGINNFNIIDDKEKTKKYIDMSSGQLSKLNLMVEKLLETATLDSESLELNKEKIDLVSLLSSLCSRYQTQNSNKTIQTSFKVESLIASVDIFHFENALNNILDNAVKYGGDIITVDLIPNKTNFNINISDNGITLNKSSKERIFEKFYRVPKGNQHDVKGFGIGLYYTKSIIEKHDGNINLNLNNKLTSFKIELPNG